ncbi:hypothetical protein EJE24_09820 [Enterobacter huaxiensis]|uniref:Uncharacterized protein n=1 Tax=Enterobacter huaxiensis TaxID=2494702 RepID=A0A428LT37_9ENTR|nr:hypothetical protein [Enterobacter huaxiensis]RSK68040.1 hypothetical protein EJE24_09820 [Enterobacter huaxiensis]
MGIRSWISSAVSYARDAVSSVVSKAKEVVGKAIGFMAEKADGFVGKVSQMWERIKPHIATGRKIVQMLGGFITLPWVKAALIGLDRALAWLEKLDKQPLMKKLQKALEWVINWCKDSHQKQMEEQELAEARRHAQAMAEAEGELSGEEKEAVSAFAVVNSYLIAKAEVDIAVKRDTLQDFEYFLRLRAVQKLLAFYETCMQAVKSISDIDADMHFMVYAANALIQQDAEFSDADTLRLDALTQRHFGKPIIPFVFEEMIIAWEKSRQLLEEEWENKNSALSKDQVLHKRLVRAQKYEELEPAEVGVLNDLKITLPRDTADLDKLGDDLLARRSYVNAAEGFLQMLEKDEQQLIAEGKEYLLDQGATVGALLIDCSQNDRTWSSLSLEEQSLIVDFANIFGADCQKRTEAGTLVEVMA